MKRYGQLLERIADPENLRAAFWKASKGKRAKADCLAFRKGLDNALGSLRAELLGGEVVVGQYHYFRIHDPKERLICAASFRERVLQHAIMNVCEPFLERAAIADSYACRKGKGQLAAVARAQAYASSHAWHLKMDIRKYFDSIDHAVLTNLLARKFKDPLLLRVFALIVASYETSPGKGVPIGNLTSQHFANYYLAPLDRFVKETLGCRAYVRYMDDFVVWADDAATLRRVWAGVAAFLAEHLRLELKPNVDLNRTGHGMDFLGYRLRGAGIGLARRSRNRFRRKFRRYERAHESGQWSQLVLQQRVEALIAFTLPAVCHAFRKRTIERFGVTAIGLEPRETRRQLEQQREEQPGSEPQQQQPGQQEQQPGFPRCSAPSSIPCDGVDPAVIPSLAALWPGRTAGVGPPGASRLTECNRTLRAVPAEEPEGWNV